ncbi:hypothetical protein ACI3PL_31950, partial [Lacticaseibacillus paracasei]
SFARGAVTATARNTALLGASAFSERIACRADRDAVFQIKPGKLAVVVVVSGKPQRVDRVLPLHGPK